MIRHLAIALLATAALGGCATDYAYRGGAGAGDYYYGRPSVEYYDYGYGAPYGSAYGYPGGGWGGGLSIGYGHGGYGGYGGYGYPYGYGGGYSYYPPYYWNRPHRPHRPDRPPPVDGPRRVTGGNLPANMVRRDAPRSPVYALPRDGQRPMRPPPSAQRPWQGRGNMGMGQARPPMSRPSQPAMGPSPGGRGNVVERRPDPRPAPSVIRQSRPSPPASSPEREPVRELKR